ncbi:BQ5605_C008g05004 [Microbotryum silenes-dioicae]|uniref:BQ5605_C008g05004 protein n=1 Tax=Microbotryum silenes-dioicae TaxID=796604 RepID=A0A2X0P7I2_9BASI|nr:BQ5605_C008g05004 [Microbotryum silenes-dioicae]
MARLWRKSRKSSCPLSWSLFVLAAFVTSCVARSSDSRPERAPGRGPLARTSISRVKIRQQHRLTNPYAIHKIPISSSIRNKYVIGKVDDHDSDDAQDSRDECVHNSTARQINRMLKEGGPETRILLCQHAHISIDPHTEPIRFTAPRQAILTVGNPDQNARALIVIETGTSSTRYNGHLTTAVDASCPQCTGVQILSVQIDGGRTELGAVEGGDALVLLGGDGGEQLLRGCEISHARGFALVHVEEGIGAECEGVVISDNVFRDAGLSPLDLMLSSELARLRDGPPPYRGRERPGLWTDGISVACARSTIIDNAIVNVSGAGIILRGAPATSVASNIITAIDRDMLVAIAAVPNPRFGLRDHEQAGLTIAFNQINAVSAMVRVGIATGSDLWAINRSKHVQGSVSFGTDISSNHLRSGSGYFGYTFAFSEARGIVVQHNTVAAAIWGAPTMACTRDLPMAPLVRNARTARGSLQPEVESEPFEFLLCVGPGSKASEGVAGREMTRHIISRGSRGM